MQHRNTAAISFLLAGGMALLIVAAWAGVLASASEEAPIARIPGTVYQVSGQITDAETGWPVYARIDIENGPEYPIWTDPDSGSYAVWLEEGIVYTFLVNAQLPGYLPQSRPVGPLTGNQVENFAIQSDATCTAPGYHYTAAYWEDFEEGEGGYTHTGWEDEWEWGTPITWPAVCASGSFCWGTDLDDNYNNNANNQLLSPLIDLSDIPYGAPLHARWAQAWHVEGGSTDHIYAEISINGGPYEILWQHTGPTAQVDWTEMDFNLQYAAGGTVRFRFRMVSDTSTTYSGYYIDQVRIVTECFPPDGGLVVGNVLHAWTDGGLNGTLVASDEGRYTTAAGTPDDPNLTDGFYWLYASPGSHLITATHPGYSPLSVPVAVTEGNAVWQDFPLLVSGSLTAEPASLQAFLPVSRTHTATLELINSGAGEIGYEISEAGEGTVQSGYLDDVTWLSVSPVSGTIPIGTSQWISVTFDSRVPGIIVPGEYHAALHVANNASGGELSIPVTMTVPAVGVELGPPALSLSGEPGATVLYSLTLTNTGTISDSYRSELNGNQWITTLPPEIGPLTPGSAVPFTVTVEVPVDAAGGETDSVQVIVASEACPDIHAEAVLNTTALPVYGLDANPLMDTASGAPGSWVTYTLTVTNTGNITDTFNIETDSVWPIEAPAATLAVAADEATSISIHVNVPAAALAGDTDTATVQLTSQGDGITSAEAVLITTASAVFGIDVFPELLPVNGSPGDVLTVSLEVTNTGNISDTIAVNISSTWVVSGASFLGPLLPGDSANLVLLVIIPNEAAGGDLNTALVTLTSVGDDAAQDSAIILISVIDYALILEPESIAGWTAPMETVTYTFTLTNTGSASDDYRLYLKEVTPGWVVALTQEPVSLPPGGSSTFQVTVTAPPNTVYGAEGSGIIEAIGTHGAMATSILTTTVDHGLIHLPAVLYDS